MENVFTDEQVLGAEMPLNQHAPAVTFVSYTD